MRHAAFLSAALLPLALACAPATAWVMAEPAWAATPAIESCVSHDRLAIAAGDRVAVLDDDDERAVRATLLRLYPVIEDDGMAPQRLLLLQRHSGELVYVALLANPQQPAESCFTASFAAGKVDTSLLLRRKYFLGDVATR